MVKNNGNDNKTDMETVSVCVVIKFQLTFNTTLEAKSAVGVFATVTGKAPFFWLSLSSQ